MKERSIGYGVMLALLAVLLVLLTGCGESIPSEAKMMVLRGFDTDQNVRIDSAQQVELTEVDLAMNAEEVWCVSLIYTCWSCDRNEFRTCADNRLVRRINGHWQVFPILTDEDRAQWEARGCVLLPDIVGE
jgi:hypothetical protein